MKLILAFTFIFSFLQLNAQLNQNTGHVYFATGYGQVDSAAMQTYGVRGEWLVHERLGLNYNFEFVKRNDKIYQIHSSAGTLIGPPLIIFGLVTSGDSGWDVGGWGTVAGILLLVAPEGVSYHIPIRYRWDLSPYANFLGADFMKNNNTDKWYIRYAGSYGLKMSFWQESGLTFTAFTETRKVAGMGWGLNAGIGIGYAWE